ncbi:MULTISPECIES: TetR family transcriptional regulator C-terminal domain-containing protein [unclassified Streptomyces]|uniref:TetR/AcrR family transcriptional regulator n=1 Tax=unclassified Streptomyces TaxID=2593676 RepID=UPI002E819F7A|nr:TetR family transcriptional regulator C-terminal domain-containing protein [Streptomyces sp. NBC_00562]WTC78006.1 TetR family transcriptional regulator C-terminal domain-containing protein [Streptomyces sp. NBC_01653]WTD92856.1 TetR family transcriptional regulator C-terminal domain-containing protein [Streptomyces sp. NBC_01637]WUC23922.1 TetR family transcriptional regulator C-terminal domain-containing protein [Streptomyces sp. NBC_00562]
MSSSVQRKRIRKSPAARRAEIVDAAATIALTEGLECITLRRIGEQLDVRPGLISHYFPSAEDLVAEAFGSAASTELDTLLPAERADGTPTQRLARFFAHATGEAYDDISRLWINARHLSRYRPVLRGRVGEQEAAWRGRLESLVREGVEREEFHTDDPYVTTIQILVVIDGLGAHANTDTGDRPEAVTRMAITTAERELGLPGGALTRPLDASTETDQDPASAAVADPAAEPTATPN